MRTLVWAAVPFAAAVCLSAYLIPAQGLPFLAAALFLAAFVLCFVRREETDRRPFLALVAGGIGFLWFFAWNAVVCAPAEALIDSDAEITAVVTDWPVTESDYSRVEIRLQMDGVLPVRALLYSYGDDYSALCPGDRLCVTARVRDASVRSGEQTTLYTSDGIRLILYAKQEVTALGRARLSWIFFPKTLCHGVKELCDRVFSEETAPFFKAMLTGDTRDLRRDKLTYSALRTAGILHITAVSGMHVFYLVSLCQLALGYSRRTGLVCIPLIVLFVLMTGCSPSSLRAAVMQILILLAPFFDRESDSPTSLCAALVLLLLINPQSITGVSLQLSFACVIGLLVLLPRLRSRCEGISLRRNKPLRFVTDSLCCSLSAAAFSAPLMALYFGSITLLSPLANLVTLPVLEICFCGGWLLTLLGGWLPSVAKAGGLVLSLGVRWCEWVCRLLANLPFARLYTVNRYVAWWLIFVCALAVAWWVCARVGSRLRLRVPLAFGAGALAVAVLCSVLLYGGQGTELAVLDVGQGECVVLSGDGGTVVVDCGGGRYLTDAGDTAADYLYSRGKSSVDAVILTHLHADHADGVEELMARIPVRRIYIPERADNSEELIDAIETMALRTGTELVYLTEDTTLTEAGMTLTLLSPDPDSAGQNESCLLILARSDNRTALIMGDATETTERDLIASRDLTEVDLLVVGHHGSSTSTSQLFLNAVQPSAAVISVGYNTYGHPTEEVLSRLADTGASVYRTDEDGTVIFSLP